MKKKKKVQAYNSVKNLGILIFIWGIGIVILLGAYALTKRGETTSHVSIENTNTEMNIYTIDTNGSAVLLESRGNFVLMNSGSEDPSDTVIEFVSSKIANSKASGKYKTFSIYLSNLDDSYIGEVSDILNHFKIDNLYLPKEDIVKKAEEVNKVDGRKVSNKYHDIIKLADSKKIEVVFLSEDYEIVFGDSKISILGLDINYQDYKSVSDYIKNSSVVSLVTVGETKYLSTGSISSNVENLFIDKYQGNLKANIYNLSNYGDDNSNSAEFLKYVDPDYSVSSYINSSNKDIITKAAKRSMYYGPFASTKYNGNISISIKNDNVLFKMNKNTVKVKVLYKVDSGEKLSSKIYNISKNNTLSEHWSFFVNDFEGYEKSNIKYGISLANITSNNYGVGVFKGIENLNKNIDIDVIYSEILIDSMRLNSDEVKLDIGDSISLTATVEPYNAKRSEYIWESDNKSIATVKDGVVTGISKGMATITVRMKNSAISAKCVVYVGDFDTTISGLSFNYKDIVVGKNVELPLNLFENENIEWAVANTDILTVSSDNILKPIKKGVTVITGNLNGYTDSICVRITDGLIISGVKEGTTISALLNDMKLDKAKVIGNKGDLKSSEEKVATRDILVIEEDKKISIYSISVLGDINGDEVISKADYDLLKEYLDGKKKLNKVALKSADINSDGKINNIDLRILNNYLKK